MTTSHKARPDTITRSIDFAKRNGYDHVQRGDDGIEVLLGPRQAALVMANSGGLHLATRHGSLTAHLGTAYIRLKSMNRGDGDPLIRAGEIRPGDHIIDTTFGLGRDAIVAACAAGSTGQVTAIESSDALFHIGQHGLAGGPLSPAKLEAVGDTLSAASITLIHANATQWLSAAADNSADVVLVDPMFEEPKTSDTGFELLRSVADTSPLTEEWIAQARRVARRYVVIKTGRAPSWFDSIGVERVHSHSNATWWRLNSDSTLR